MACDLERFHPAFHPTKAVRPQCDGGQQARLVNCCSWLPAARITPPSGSGLLDGFASQSARVFRFGGALFREQIGQRRGAQP